MIIWAQDWDKKKLSKTRKKEYIKNQNWGAIDQKCILKTNQNLPQESHYSQYSFSFILFVGNGGVWMCVVVCINSWLHRNNPIWDRMTVVVPVYIKSIA